MTCPVCGEKTVVLDTNKTGEEIYRCRRCKECGHRFYTTESELKTSKSDYGMFSRHKKLSCKE